MGTLLGQSHRRALSLVYCSAVPLVEFFIVVKMTVYEVFQEYRRNLSFREIICVVTIYQTSPFDLENAITVLFIPHVQNRVLLDICHVKSEKTVECDEVF